jgi:hypothetical protein
MYIMSDLNYYSLKDFVDLTSEGKIGPSMFMDLRNLNGNQIHRISYNDHCKHLCDSENIGLLNLLVMIREKINEDMLYRTTRSPIFTNKINGISKDWAEPNITPEELFRTRMDNPFDYHTLRNEKELVEHLGREMKLMNDNSKDNESNLYESLHLLKTDCHDCSTRLQKHVSQLEENRECYEPNYRNIWSDLSTTQKVSYFNDLLHEIENKEDQSKMIRQINKRVNKDIPDEIHMMFMNGLLIPTMMLKENEMVKFQFLQLQKEIEGKMNQLSELLKLYPDPALELEGESNFLSSIQKLFQNLGASSSDEELDEELDRELLGLVDEEPVTKEDIKDALEKYVQKDRGFEDDASSVNSEKSTMFHLALDDQAKQQPSFF